MGTRFFDVGTAQLAFDAHGEGPVVVIAHGLTMSRAADREQALTEWDRLVKKGFRVVAYDARGHGETAGRDEPDDYRWENLATDLLALAEAISPDEPVHAIGSSMGTATILHALTRRPERFRSVALTAPPTAWETRKLQQRVYEATAAAAETMTLDDFVAASAAAPVPEIFAERWNPGPPSIDMAVLPAVFRGAGVSDLPAQEEVARIETPALILPWATDPGHPLSTAERLTELMPHAELEVAEDIATIKAWPNRVAEFFTAHP
ncbi:alpha/beta fold hydrolase [Microbacterium bovistercoris]|uniref:Alpha/beta fold hydrolase n=1 Tax=Microbacterium bovistercoris TaxID=2293570 RepID=A0A371NQF8_9MICO|nr:alpha/beta fold hydrolase [Microbacterium bovistercoris]REJ03947.1 alpha/beta fold hydrolase [Microbacterium bovistercoris]